MSTGEGFARLDRFFYDPASKSCKSFIYKGLKGNQNNFLTLVCGFAHFFLPQLICLFPSSLPLPSVRANSRAFHWTVSPPFPFGHPRLIQIFIFLKILALANPPKHQVAKFYSARPPTGTLVLLTFGAILAQSQKPPFAALGVIYQFFFWLIQFCPPHFSNKSLFRPFGPGNGQCRIGQMVFVQTICLLPPFIP
jgi:hypothetical protein